MRAHYAVTCDWASVRLRTKRDQIFPELNMLAIRVYISALTLLFLFLTIAIRGLGILEAIVVTCAILFLIIDVRIDLQALKLEFRLLQELEEKLSELVR
jgi:hypothetical membrane protein